MDVAEKIGAVAAALTPAERRVAEVLLADPSRVAFATVADLAAEAGVGAATVVRLAAKLDYDGYSALQAAARDELARRLGPAADRIRQPDSDDVIERALHLESENVRASLTGLDRTALAAAVDLLGDPERRIAVVAGDATRGVGTQWATELGMLRADVIEVGGSPAAVARQLALLEEGDVLWALDLRRYERWVVEAVDQARVAGVAIVAVTDSLLSPLAQAATVSFVVAAAGAGPFDSHAGTLAVGNVVIAAVARRVRAGAADRLGRIEAAWQSHHALAAGPTPPTPRSSS